MKNAEWLDLPLELEQRLKQGVDQLREMRESMEDLVQIADAIRPLLGLERMRVRATATPRPATRAAGAQTQVGRGTAAEPPPPQARRPQTPPGSAPSAPASPDEVPEWRRVFPALSAEVPGRVGENKKKK